MRVVTVLTVLFVIPLMLLTRGSRTEDRADFVYANQNEIFTLDPQRMHYLQDFRVAHALYEGLYRWDNRTHESIHPGVAATLPLYEDDGRTITVHIRTSSRWSDGTSVTAEDFVYSWKRALMPDTASPYATLFFLVDGAEDFFNWRLGRTNALPLNPWLNTAAPSADERRILADRLDALLDPPALPALLPRPPTGEHAALRKDILRLRAGDTDHASGIPAWLDALADPVARKAEISWLWEETAAQWTRTVGVAAVSPGTLKIRLVRPVPWFIDLLCFPPFFPVHRPSVEGWPDSWNRDTPPPIDQCRWISLDQTTGRLVQKHGWMKPDRHVGNGPYHLHTWRYRRHLRLARSDTYSGTARGQSDSIEIRTIPVPNTAVMAFEMGEVDWLADVGTSYEKDMITELTAYELLHQDELQALLAAGRTREEALALLPEPRVGERRNIHVVPAFATEFYAFNCREKRVDGSRNPFADAAVRRAFTLSLDRTALVHTATRLEEPVTGTFIPPGTIAGYVSPRGLLFDPAQGRREMEAAGWQWNGNRWTDAQGQGFPVVEILHPTGTRRSRLMALAAKAQWEATLGVSITLRGVDANFYRRDRSTGNFMVARASWYGDYGDPTTFLDLFRSGGSNNYFGYRNPELDALLERAEREPDPVRRLRILGACEAVICREDVPLLPICQLTQNMMYEPDRVTGISHHPRLNQYLWQVKVRRP